MNSFFKKDCISITFRVLHLRINCRLTQSSKTNVRKSDRKHGVKRANKSLCLCLETVLS